MRRLLACVCLLLLLIVPTFAQDTAVAPSATPLPTFAPPPTLAPAVAIPTIYAIGTIQSENLEVAQEAADRAEDSINLAFNLLGIFEAIGFLVTIIAGAAGVFGFQQLLNARRDLTDTRTQLLQEARELRQRFEDEIKRREDDLRQLEQNLLTASKDQGETTHRALLANALMPLGERQYKAGDYQGTLNTYLRALELDPKNPVVNQRLGYVYTQRGDLHLAKQHYETAIAQESNFAPALAGLGFVYRRLGEKLEKQYSSDGSLTDAQKQDQRIDRDRLFTQAEDLLLQALKISPRLVDDDGESWWGVVGGLYKRRGQIDQAIEAYRQVTVVTPESSYGFGNLALLYMKKNMLKDMLTTYTRVEQIAAREASSGQGNFWGYADLIVSRFALGKIDSAMGELATAITIAPEDSPYMLEGLAETLEDLVKVLPPERVQPILHAVGILRKELEQRRNQQPVMNQ